MTKFSWRSQSVIHVGGIQVVKRVVDRIISIIQMPMDTLEMKTDLFAKKVVLQKFHVKPTDELMFATNVFQ